MTAFAAHSRHERILRQVQAACGSLPGALSQLTMQVKTVAAAQRRDISIRENWATSLSGFDKPL
jgi:hypothetical protein